MRATDDFAQLQLAFIDPIQRQYEVIRPVVLFAETVSERSRQTGIDRDQISEHARRFVIGGMTALADQRAAHAGRRPHAYPEPVAAYILYLKQLYSPLHNHEIARIIGRKFGYVTNHNTVKRFLERHALPVQLPLPLPQFHDFDDAYRARWTVVKLWAEGWSKASIAGCLQLSRKHVHTLIDAFRTDGFVGLEDHRTRPPSHPENQLTLSFLQDVLKHQEAHPRAGRTRIRAILEQQYHATGLADAVPSERTVGRAMALNRAVHGAPGPWPPEPRAPDRTDPTPLPYPPVHRHLYWFIYVTWNMLDIGHTLVTRSGEGDDQIHE